MPENLFAHRFGQVDDPNSAITYREMFFRTRVIVRLGLQNRMVTKGYRKGVYEWVTLWNHACRVLAAAGLRRDDDSAPGS